MANDTSKFLVAETQLLLDEARRQKSERIRTVGSPIQLSGKALAIEIRGNHAWIAENTAVARKLDLESGKTLQLYKGHSGPVTTIAFCDKVYGSGDEKILITGSWDRTIKFWDTETKDRLSSVIDAHGDFVKNLLVIPSIRLLISSGSDKIVRFWDISVPEKKEPPMSLGSISSHTRPVECLAGKALSSNTAALYTADTMGVIRCWTLKKESGALPRIQTILQKEFNHHRTRINEMYYNNGQLWTASSDETAQLILEDAMGTDEQSVSLSINHPAAVRSILPLAFTDLSEPYLITGAGDVLRVYDLTTSDKPELIRDVDAHWHDVTAIRLWKRTSVDGDNKTWTEPWVISTSLDGTIRKWKLSELLTTALPTQACNPTASLIFPSDSSPNRERFVMSEEEQRELDELLGPD